MASSSTIPEEGSEELIQDTSFDSLPEGCIVTIISFTTPADACRLALVSKDVLAASESDVVWNRFLPSDIDLILSRADEQDALLTKKQLYKRLINDRLLVDQSSKIFWLDCSTGKKCWMISARGLYIAWSQRRRNWNWSPVDGSRFPEAAELVSVEWYYNFYISTNIQTSMLSPSTQYESYLVYSMTNDASGFTQPFKASVSVAGDGSTYTEPVYLDVRPSTFRVEGRRPRKREDGWWEMMIGKFSTNDPGEEGDEVALSVTMMEALDNTKGIIIDGIEYRPAEVE